MDERRVEGRDALKGCGRMSPRGWTSMTLGPGRRLVHSPIDTFRLFVLAVSKSETKKKYAQGQS